MNLHELALGRLSQKMQARMWVHKNAESAQRVFHQHAEEFKNVFGLESYREFLENSRSFKRDIAILGKSTVILPSLYLGYELFSGFPDLDISTLGIGQHRYWLFHSGLAAYAIQRLHALSIGHLGDSLPERVVRKSLDALAGGACLGLGIHLMADFLTPKSIQFPFIGSLVDCTMVDDSIWTLGNSLYCFRLASDIFALGLGKDLDELKNFIWREFGVLPGKIQQSPPKAQGEEAPAKPPKSKSEGVGGVKEEEKSGSKEGTRSGKNTVGPAEHRHLYPWGEDPDEEGFVQSGDFYE